MMPTPVPIPANADGAATAWAGAIADLRLALVQLATVNSLLLQTEERLEELEADHRRAIDDDADAPRTEKGKEARVQLRLVSDDEYQQALAKRRTYRAEAERNRHEATVAEHLCKLYSKLIDFRIAELQANAVDSLALRRHDQPGRATSLHLVPTD